MEKLHIAQDDYGFWMLSHEKDDGTLVLRAHQFVEPDHLIENAHELVTTGKVKAVVIIDPPRPATTPTPTFAAAETTAVKAYTRPAPRRAGV